MITEKEIKTKYKIQHDKLSEDYYKKHLLSKEDFDQQHGQLFADLETELITEGYLNIPEPPRDLAHEIEVLKERVTLIEKSRISEV